MDFPIRTDFPFFSYGIFKPGELGFYQIADYVEKIEAYSVTGTLLLRDGLPILDKEGRDEVRGGLLYFNNDNQNEGYRRIIEMEPDNQYRWDTIEVSVNGQSMEANILIGKSPQRGSVPMEEDWEGSRDPLFTSALEVVKEILEQNSEFDWQMKSLFRLQMGYLLLWSAIERYVTLRYGLGEDITKKILKLSEEEAFIHSLKENVRGSRKVVKSHKPTEHYNLNPSNPKKSLNYYYQVRSNITHRGKSVTRDFDTLYLSLRELLAIFKAVLNEAFDKKKKYSYL